MATKALSHRFHPPPLLLLPASTNNEVVRGSTRIPLLDRFHTSFQSAWRNITARNVHVQPNSSVALRFYPRVRSANAGAQWAAPGEQTSEV